MAKSLVFSAACAVSFLLAGVIGSSASERTSPKQTTSSSLPMVSVGVDPMIIGRTVTPLQHRLWQAAKRLYQDCKVCFENQAYPGDLEGLQTEGEILTGSTR
ncbi:MAG: hypothetical protein AAGF28_12350 [Pseudomonadota bacterium]